MKDNLIPLTELWGVLVRLKDDAARCMKALDETPEQDEQGRSFWRRMYALAIFAFFDGVTYRLTFHAYAARDRRDVTFSLEELNRLEGMYDFDEDAEPVSTFSKTRMLDDIRFAFNAFARVHYSDYVLPTADREWVLLLRQIARIRLALQHPREASELEVYEENVDDLLEGLRWYVERIAELLESCTAHFEAKAASWDAEEQDDVVM